MALRTASGAIPGTRARRNHDARIAPRRKRFTDARCTPLVRAPDCAKDPAMITVTERAAEKVKSIATEESLEGQGLRLRVIGGGCAGFTYDLYFEDAVSDVDEQFESLGVKLYVDPLSFQYLEDTEIDYVEGVHGSGFKFNNPNSKGSCGCGSSFSA